MASFFNLTLSGLGESSIDYPGLSLRSNPGLKLANAFGVKLDATPELKLANAFGVNVAPTLG